MQRNQKKSTKKVTESLKPKKITNKMIKSSMGSKLVSEKTSGYGFEAVRSARLNYNAGVITSGVTAQFGSFEFQMDQFQGYADYQAVFDTYRLRKVRLTFIPHVNTHTLAIVSPTTTSAVRPILTVMDLDDSNNPGSISELLQYGSVKMHSPLKEFSETFEPRCAGGMYAGGVTLGYSQMPGSTWLDIANDDIVHYGFKWGTEANGATQTVFQSWTVYVTGWFDFKQNR